MKAEINEMNKGRFLALHIGCEMELPQETDTDQWCRAFLTGIMNGGAEAELQFGDLADNASEEPEVISVSDTMAMLKPLSSISDEDAIEVARMEGQIAKGNPVFIHADGMISISVEDEYSEDACMHIYPSGSFIEWVNGDMYEEERKAGANISTYDFLRSRGYALPWMGLSVEEMVEAGWIKLT